MTRIKGFAIRGLLKYVKESGHPGGIPALLERLEPAAAAHYETKILSSRWYEYAAFTGLLHALEAGLAGGDQARLEAVGEFSGRQDAGSIFRFVAALSSIEAIAQRAPFLWQRYCTSGRFEVLECADKRLHLALEEFAEIDSAHCALIAGWIRGLGEAAGARQPDFRQVRCVHAGDPRCEFAGSWS